MLHSEEHEITSALEEANPWWRDHAALPYGDLQARAYLPAFLRLIRQHEVRRAILLLGQRRIGKTVLAHHAIRALLAGEVSPRRMMFCSLEAPVFGAVALSELVKLFETRFRRAGAEPLYVFLDEIQYLREWERHLKVLVDTKPGIRFIATGSAAATLRRKSAESGVGRITEFYLPPLTFAEYLGFTGEGELYRHDQDRPTHITTLNRAFINWLNHGGFPEAVFSRPVREQPMRYIRQDIVDKVLLRDLPSLYGIGDTQELHRFFALLAYNTGQELSISELSKRANIAKDTLNKYLQYLEAAFLIRRSRRVDQDGRHFKRATAFKVYLTNPSLRAALYSNLDAGDSRFGALVETGVAMHLTAAPLGLDNLRYARWPSGEVDFVHLTPDQGAVLSALEVKWSDTAIDSAKNLKPLARFCRGKALPAPPMMTTRSVFAARVALGQTIDCVPAAHYCFITGVAAANSER